MAYFDRERQELVVRIVYDGPATAGKTANLRSLYATFTGRADGTLRNGGETSTGRTLYFDWLELSVGYVDDWPLRCQIVSVPGQLAFADRRIHLLRQLDAVVFVCESTPAGVRAGRVAYAFLDEVLTMMGAAATPIVVQANKQDIAGALAPDDVASRLAARSTRAVIGASAIGNIGVRESFLAALDVARDVARSRLRERGTSGFPSEILSADRLREEMSDDASDSATAPILDEVLRLMESD